MSIIFFLLVFICCANELFKLALFLFFGLLIGIALFFIGISGYISDSKNLNLIENDFDAYQTKIKNEQEAFKQKQALKPECPYCHSKNTSKISTTSKVTKLALFGVLALSKTSKEWHCNNCKSDF